MSDRLQLQELSQLSLAERGFLWLRRIVAVYCLCSGVVYWARIVGAPDIGPWRFDLMPLPWQVASVTLATFFPFAAIGLWMLASWGPVIWLICAVAEITMFAGFPEIFGPNPMVVATHLLTAMLYAAFRFVIFVQKRRRAVSRH